MPNMTYCIFENTYRDLIQAYEHMQTHLASRARPALSESESAYKAKLIQLCHDIAEDFQEV